MQTDCRKCGAHIPHVSTLAEHIDHQAECEILAPLRLEALAGLTMGGRACLTTIRRTPMVRYVETVEPTDAELDERARQLRLAREVGTALPMVDHPATDYLLRSVFGDAIDLRDGSHQDGAA